MRQSSALRRLEEILSEAVNNGDKTQNAGVVLLRAMSFSEEPQYVINFYGLLNKAEEETKTLKNQPNINRYLQALGQLNEIFVVRNIWAENWSIIANNIETKNLLTTLDSLATFFYLENPTIFLEEDFLEKLDNVFKELLSEILSSDLSRELKRFLIKHIEDIQTAISRYRIDGAQELEKSVKSLVSDLVISEHNIKEEDKNNPLYSYLASWTVGLLLFIRPTVYDVISIIPDINDYWVPKFEELADGQKKIEQIINETSTIQEACEKSSNIFDRQTQKSITGTTKRKALPPSDINSQE